MPISDRILKFIAARFHIPPDAFDYFLASRHIGRGAETLLPYSAERIPLGARLVLRGWYNNQFFPTNRDWVLPYWAERQFDPTDPGFIPRGLNLYTINYTHRDWTTVGNLARRREAIVDPRGLVTPWFDGWSLDVWAEVEGELIAPSRLGEGNVSQSLDLEKRVPVVVTEFRAGEIEVRLEMSAAIEEDDSEWVIEEIKVVNPSPARRAMTLYLSVRPFNPEGVSLVRKLEYRPTHKDPFGGAWLIDSAIGVLMPQPDAVAVSDFEQGDVALALPDLNGRTRVESRTGLATGLAAYRLELAPGETKALGVRMPLEKRERDDDDPQIFSPLDGYAALPELRSRMGTTWREKMSQGMRVRLPDELWQKAFEANKAYLLLLHDGETITPGPLTYHQFWFRDAAYMLNALDKLGYHDDVRRVIDNFPRRLEKDGYLRATEGEWDSNGAAIWAMVENARLSGDKELVARNYWSILRMASWINSKRRGTQQDKMQKSQHHGLLPAGPSAEHLGPADYFYWDDFWGLAGLRDAAQVAVWLGQEKDGARLHANFDSFRKDVDASLAAVAARLGRPAMPASPYRRLDAAMVGSLAALYPLRLFDAHDPRVVDTLAALKEKAWSENAYFNHVGHSAFGTYLSLDVAECFLYQRNAEAWNIMQWVLGHASPTFTWAEGIHPITRRGGMGDGHHGWAAADFLLALRNLLLMEESDHLVITPILPQEWTAETSVIQLQDAATYFGPVSFTIAFGDRTATLVVNGNWHAEPEYIEWNLPFVLREAGGEGEGIQMAGNTVRLPLGVTRVVVMW
ncbi:MAG: hypothetical protein ACM3S0_07240 [Acidobacteriota bacterium]